MFNDHFDQQDNKRYLQFLKEIILKELKIHGRLSNVDMYELSLLNEFRPMHAKMILCELVTTKKIATIDSNGNVLPRIDAAYQDYEHFKRKVNCFFIN